MNDPRSAQVNCPENVRKADTPSVAWVLVLIGLFVLWSNSFHAIAWLRRQVDAGDLVTLRFAPVGIFCLIWAALAAPRENLRLLRREPIRLIAMGILMVPAYNLALNWGQGLVPAGTASLLIALNPLFTYLLALAVRQEPLRRRKSVGLLVSFAGVFLLLQHQGRAFGAAYSAHALTTLLAPLSWAISTVIGRPLVQRESPLRVTYLAVGLGSVFYIPAAILDGSIHAALQRFGATDWIALAHLSVNCTIVGFALWYAALRHLPASSATAFVLLNPPLTILFGPLWGTDRPDAGVLAFGVFILAGVLLSVSAPGLPRLTPQNGRR